MTEIWRPHVTVAAVIEQDGKFLFVEEQAEQSIVLNQPAGHWESDETLTDAAARETLEETGYHFQPASLVGVYRWPHPAKDIVYLRFAFAGAVLGFDANRTLDTGILRAVWLTPDDLRAQTDRHRSPLVMRCVEDYLAGKRYALDLLTHF
ncbi:MAG: NUDIX hydrolase [Betaproteobacteria bacterium RBG_16_58_11]|nr:MAG: NUDIX hydrolase [Betaproteobacteria bacterium RBG_16_58_11]